MPLFHCLTFFSGAMLTPFLANVLVKRSLVLAVSIYSAMGLAAATIAFRFLPESRGVDMSDQGSSLNVPTNINSNLNGT